MVEDLTRKQRSNAWAETSEEQAASYSRHIFVMVAGLSPQIVTETLYAAWQETPACLNHAELHLVTTQEGARRAELTLLTGEHAQLPLLIQEYNLPEITFSPEHIHVIRSRDGEALNDIRSPQDNADAADFINHFMRHITADPATCVHVSLAGGRKTMGYYIGYALSLYGRSQDTLSHVLVSEQFESNPAFFFPTRTSRIIHTRDGTPLDTHCAEVSLARIPFVRLRDELPQDSTITQAGFSEAVSLLNAATQPVQLEISLRAPCLWCNQIEICLEPMEWLLYLWFARRRLAGEPALPAPVDGYPDKPHGDAFLTMVKSLELDHFIQPRSLKVLSQGLEVNSLRSRLSNLKTKFQRHMGKRLTERFAVVNNRKAGGYTLPVPPEHIALVNRGPRRR